jgi:uncharacterized protein YndB with AHSA1/START domain
MWGKWVYRDILPPQRLVVVDSFSDPDANVTHHPMAATWPLELLTTVTFTEREGRTTVMLQWVPINATETERKAFERGHDSMRGGWTGTLDRLGEYLAGVAAAR